MNNELATTGPTLVKRRNMWLQVVLMVVTFGIYSIYWFYQTGKEMKALTRDESAQPILWTVLLFVPLLNFYATYKHSELFEQVSSERLNRWIVFLLWIAFTPAVWLIVQMDLNEKAKPKLQQSVPTAV